MSNTDMPRLLRLKQIIGDPKANPPIEAITYDHQNYFNELIKPYISIIEGKYRDKEGNIIINNKAIKSMIINQNTH